MGFKIIQALMRVFLRLCFRYRIEGTENIPSEGGAIVALNHRSYWDVVFAGACVDRPLRYMAKSTLFDNPVFGCLITKLGAFPVERGKGDVGAIRSALKILRDGNLMLIFPEGKRVRNGERVKAKSGVALIASMANVPIVPICIDGEYKFFGKIKFKIAPPIDLNAKYGRKLTSAQLQEGADEALNTIYSMEESNG